MQNEERKHGGFRVHEDPEITGYTLVRCHTSLGTMLRYAAIENADIQPTEPGTVTINTTAEAQESGEIVL